MAFWARQFGIAPRLPVLTADVDYLGTKAEARRTARRLKLPHTLRIADINDATPNAAVLEVRLDGYDEPVFIDYLAGIIGVDSRSILKSAITAEFHGEPVRILHPFHLLQAKIWNLYHLEAKRTPEGVEQARLAVEIAAAFIEASNMPQRDLLDAIESIARFAATRAAREVRTRFALDCLKAIPDSVMREGVLPPDFHEKRWPQLVAAAS